MTAPAPRTTAELVGKIVDVDEGVDVTPFIRAATMLTTRACGASGYTDDGEDSEMEVIERWLAAHFYQISNNPLAFARAGSVAASFQYKVNYDLRNTEYGQQAMMLDTAGNLAALNNANQTRKKVTIGGDWLGRDLCLTYPYRRYPWDN